jgi:hypothetical protein
MYVVKDSWSQRLWSQRLVELKTRGYEDSSGARPALLVGVDSWSQRLIGCTTGALDGSIPRGYVRLLVAGHRFILSWY